MDPTPEPTPNLPAVPPERRPVADPWATGRRRASGTGPDPTARPGPDPTARPGPDPTARPGPDGTAGPAADDAAGGPASGGPAGGPGPDWRRRLRPRNPKVAVGLGLVAAALLLLPFLDDPSRWWVPVGIGAGALVLLSLLRLDRLLFGWAPHVAGVVLVGALVWATSDNPWSWGLAAGAGAMLAGLLLLPRWRVLAVGVAILVISGVGYQFRSAEITERQAQVDAQAGNEMRMVLGVTRPQLALVNLDNGVRDNDPDRVCRIVQDPALTQLLQVTGSPDCDAAVAVLHGRSTGVDLAPTQPSRKADPAVAPGGRVGVDGCSSLWGAAAGPGLGRVELVRTNAAQERFQVTGFRPC